MLIKRFPFFGPAPGADADLDNKRIGRDNFYNNDFGHPIRNFGTQSAGNLVFGGVAGQAGSIQSGWFRAYVRFRNLPSAEKSFLTLGHTASATPGVHFSITTTGKLRIYNTHTIVANSVLIVESTGSMNIAADETGWNKLEGFVLYSASVANTGSVIFFLNGVQLY